MSALRGEAQLRAAATLASRRHGRARGSTLRRHLITIPARLAHHGRHQVILHLTQDWPWQDAFSGLFDATHPPTPARPRGLTRHPSPRHTPTAPAAHPRTTERTHRTGNAAEPSTADHPRPQQRNDQQSEKTIT